MTKQETIERGALAYVNFVRAEKGFPLVTSLDGFRPEDLAGYIAHVSAVFAALRPGDVLPGGMVVEAGWQPMETVPKDGTEVRFADDYGTYSVWWVDGDWYFYGERPNDPYAPYVDPASERRLLPPKHWRPLPATPKGGA